MKKAIKLILISIVLAMSGMFFYLWREEYKNEKDKNLSKDEIGEVLSNTNDGTTYIYSEKEIELLREQAYSNKRHGETVTYQKYLNRMKEKIDNAPEDYIKDMEEDFGTFEKFLEDKMVPVPSVASQLSNLNLITPKYNRNTVSAEDILNSDLSLKEPEYFLGFVKVPMLDITKMDKEDSWKYKEFVSSLHSLDDYYKDSDGSVLTKTLFAGTISKNADYHFSGDFENMVGSEFVAATLYRNNKATNSMNSLQAFMKARPATMNVHESLRYMSGNTYNADSVPYDAFPDEYNYFLTEYEEYREVAFYPTRIQKIDDVNYVIDICVDSPVDNNIANYIRSLIVLEFGDTRMAPAVVSNEKFDLIVNITYNNISSGMLIDYSLTSVVNLADKGERYLSNSLNYPSFIDWFPNSESQEWVREYFKLAKDAFDANERFSIFETIEKVANKFEVDYYKVENVITSYYYLKAFLTVYW